MATSTPTLRPLSSSLSSWKNLLRASRQQRPSLRCLSTTANSPPEDPILPAPHKRLRSPFRILNDSQHILEKKLKTYPPPPSVRRTHPIPLAAWTSTHLSTLDPTGTRTRLFDRSNPDCPQPGDILLATFMSGDPFSGVCLSIRRRGVDTGVLLRNRLMGTGVEMWVKIYSPLVRSVEVVKRAEKRARRARLYYLRKPEHDRGSVEGEVEEYLKRRRLIRSGASSVGGKEKGVGGKR